MKWGADLSFASGCIGRNYKAPEPTTAAELFFVADGFSSKGGDDTNQHDLERFQDVSCALTR